MDNTSTIAMTSITWKQFTDWLLATLRQSAWAPLSVFGIYLLAFIAGLYELYPPLDIPTHFLGGVAITYFFRSAIYQSQKIVGGIPLPIQILFAITATGTITILWELAEYTSDFLLATQHMHGLEDTLRDMVMGLLGALLLSLFHRRR